MPALSGTLFDLSGKTALVTGASRGIGRAIARQLARHGARVALASRSREGCEAVADEIRAEGGTASAFACDLGHADSVSAFCEAMLAAYPGIDILAANAGLVAHVGGVGKLKAPALDAMWAANLKGHLGILQRLLPGMAERRDGAIVFTGSVSGLTGEAKLGGYALTKAAEMQLVRNISVEYGRHNVRANAVAPGLVRTDMTKPLWSDAATLARMTSAYPL
jgi:NAD(P)-dependent dehydrogenase (short-subunit alcohol dehydrogenase family)